MTTYWSISQTDSHAVGRCNERMEAAMCGAATLYTISSINWVAKSRAVMSPAKAMRVSSPVPKYCAAV